MKVLELFDKIKKTFRPVSEMQHSLVYENGKNESVYVDYHDEGESDYQVETVTVVKFGDWRESELPEYNLIIQKPTEATVKMVMDILIQLNGCTNLN